MTDIKKIQEEIKFKANFLIDFYDEHKNKRGIVDYRAMVIADLSKEVLGIIERERRLITSSFKIKIAELEEDRELTYIHLIDGSKIASIDSIKTLQARINSDDDY